MKLYVITTMALSLFGLLAGAADNPNPGAPAKPATADKLDLKDPKVRISYSIGADIGTSFKRQELDVDPKAVAAGLADSYAGKAQLTDAEMKEVMTQFRQQLMEKVHTQTKVDGEKNTKSGEVFLAENAKKEGVKSTASGLQYKVIKSGKGKTPKAADKVKVHYHGSLPNGEVFDSSIDRGEPVTFGVNQVIPGWTEALQLMKEGDKWQLVIPSKLAYGEKGAGGKIGPNAVLIFDVELLEVQ